MRWRIGTETCALWAHNGVVRCWLLVGSGVLGRVGFLPVRQWWPLVTGRLRQSKSCWVLGIEILFPYALSGSDTRRLRLRAVATIRRD
jgi:hypothetical protein